MRTGDRNTWGWGQEERERIVLGALFTAGLGEREDAIGALRCHRWTLEEHTALFRAIRHRSAIGRDMDPVLVVCDMTPNRALSDVLSQPARVIEYALAVIEQYGRRWHVNRHVEALRRSVSA